MIDPHHSLLLVAPESLPRGLLEALGQRGLWVDLVEPAFLAPALVAASPRLVVCTDRHWAEVEAALGIVAASQPSFAFVLHEEGGAPRRRHGRLIGWTSSRTSVESIAQKLFGLVQEAAETAPATVADPTMTGEPPRVSLRGRMDRVFPLRVALRDSNERRAKDVATALYRDGHEVRFVTRSVLETPWPRLRSYAPHVLLVDEDSYREDMGIWFAAFRQDVHLGHTPLVIYPFASLEGPQGIELGPLFSRLAGLARIDRGLVNHLEPGRSVELDLHQIGPTRLLRVLGTFSCDVKILASFRGEALHWGVRSGQATRALLTGRTESQIGPEEALGWLLHNPQCSLVLSALSQLRLRPQVPLERLLLQSHRDLLSESDRHGATRRDLRSAFPEAPPPSISLPDEERDWEPTPRATPTLATQQNGSPLHLADTRAADRRAPTLAQNAPGDSGPGALVAVAPDAVLRAPTPPPLRPSEKAPGPKSARGPTTPPFSGDRLQSPHAAPDASSAESTAFFDPPMNPSSESLALTFVSPRARRRKKPCVMQ